MIVVFLVWQGPWGRLVFGLRHKSFCPVVSEGGVPGTFWKPPSQNPFWEPFSEPFFTVKPIADPLLRTLLRTIPQNPPQNSTTNLIRAQLQWSALCFVCLSSDTLHITICKQRVSCDGDGGWLAVPYSHTQWRLFFRNPCGGTARISAQKLRSGYLNPGKTSIFGTDMPRECPRKTLVW